MLSIKDVNKIRHQKNTVIVGVSRSGNKIGNALYTELKKKNFNVFQINPNVDEINGEKCYRDFESLPSEINTAILTVLPTETLNVVKSAAKNGINNIWMQLGSGSKEAENYCKENKITYVYNQCFLMYAEPVEGFHKFHGWVWEMFGKYAK